MAQAKTGDTVKVHYTGTLTDGTIFDSSVNREPLQFTIGDGGIIEGFEQAVLGMNPGESKIAELPSHEAYGPRHEDLVLVIDQSELPPDLEPTIGMQLQGRHDDGTLLNVTVTQVSESKVTLDGNHPLAGKDLVFDILLVEIV